MQVIREERGWAGHFIAANSCNFRRNTLLTYGARRVVVSTVGAMHDVLHEGKWQEIGYLRYYETMAFEAMLVEDTYWDADVGAEVSFASPWALDHIDLKSDMEANDMHEMAVAEITRFLSHVVDDDEALDD